MWIRWTENRNPKRCDAEMIDAMPFIICFPTDLVVTVVNFKSNSDYTGECRIIFTRREAPYGLSFGMHFTSSSATGPLLSSLSWSVCCCWWTTVDAKEWRPPFIPWWRCRQRLGGECVLIRWTVDKRCEIQEVPSHCGVGSGSVLTDDAKSTCKCVGTFAVLKESEVVWEAFGNTV